MTIFETSRLVLREWEDRDIIPFSLMNQDPQITKFYHAPFTEEESIEMIGWQRLLFQKVGFCYFPVEIKATCQFIGYVGLSIPRFIAHFTPCVGIAWQIAVPYWNQGYATEAAKKVLSAAFEKYDLNEIVAYASPKNFNSINIMKKLGMRYNPLDNFELPSLKNTQISIPCVLYRVRSNDRIEKHSNIN